MKALSKTAATVAVNPEKPGKGNFIVRVKGSDVPLVDLRSMKRPFKDLKDLNFDELEEKLLAAVAEQQPK